MTQRKENVKQQSYWLKASICLDPAMQEALEDYLLGVLGAGVEQAVDGDSTKTCLHVFFDERDPDEARQTKLKNDLESYAQELARIFHVAVAEISWELIKEQDWSRNWKVHFKPFAIIPRLIIAPTWEEYQAESGELVITMDPGMAFGTGHHATTSLALAFVDKIVTQEKEKQRVLDVGTGTGILGMGAALFGASRVLGIDNDPEAVRIAGENVLLNGLEGVMEVAATPLSEIRSEYTLIAANIIHDVLVEMRDELKRLLVGGGNLVLSGILHGEQEENIIRYYGEIGFTVKGKEQREEWAALWMSRGES